MNTVKNKTRRIVIGFRENFCIAVELIPQTAESLGLSTSPEDPNFIKIYEVEGQNNSKFYKYLGNHIPKPHTNYELLNIIMHRKNFLTEQEQEEQEEE